MCDFFFFFLVLVVVNVTPQNSYVIARMYDSCINKTYVFNVPSKKGHMLSPYHVPPAVPHFMHIILFNPSRSVLLSIIMGVQTSER